MIRLLRHERGWGLVLLLAAMVAVAGRALAATGWAEGLESALWAALGGLLAGTLLGWSVLPGPLSHAFSAVYGIAWLGYLLGRSLPGALLWRERILALAHRLGHWFQQVTGGGRGHDPLIFVLLMAILAWLLGYGAAWNTFRRPRAWAAILPLGGALFATVYYYQGPARLAGYLALYLFLALLYLGATHVAQVERRLRQYRVGSSNEASPALFRAAALLAVAVLALAWGLPTAAASPSLAARWRRLSDPWHVVHEEWQRLFASLRGPALTGLVEPFGPTLVLGGPQRASDTLLFDVIAPPRARYTWRGAVYDTYAGDRWLATESERLLLLPGRVPPGLEQTDGRYAVTQTITSYIPNRTALVAAAQWAAFDREAEALVDLRPEAPLNVIRVFSVLPLVAGERYTAISYMSDASATALRGADGDYPEWVLQGYLALPPSLPPRVRLFAEDVTAGAATAYDRALAIERYLRGAIAYDREPPSLPPGRDYVDFLLFDSPRAYCNGYATAMVVLARSVGIPARLAVGYAQGEYDPARGVFRVRESNAHAWPELYFPRYGWIEFEPTASEQPYVRPEEAQPPAPEGPGPSALRPLPSEEEGVPGSEGPGAAAGNQPKQPVGALAAAVWPVVGALALSGFVLAGWWALENWRLRDLVPSERAYARLLRYGRWFGQSPPTSETPREWAQGLVLRAPGASGPVLSVVEAYLHYRYGRRGTSTVEQPAVLWPRARAALWRAWWQRLLPARVRRGDRKGRPVGC